MQYQISPLAKLTSSIPTLAAWHHKQWQHLNSKQYTLAARIRDYQQTARRHDMPVMYVAHQDYVPLGSARLVQNDMDIYTELSPWLASLYVDERYRHQGIASALIKTIETAACNGKFQKIYLYTENSQPLYTNLAWQVLAEETYYNEAVTIMQKTLFK